MSPRLLRLLKALRASQPFNVTATTVVRALLASGGWHSETVIKHLHRVGPVRSRLPNGRVLRLSSRADDWISNQVFWRGWHGYEPETSPLFFALAAKAAVTLDVGAYVGFFTLLAAHANPSGRVFAFEPLRAAFERLNSNVRNNRLHNVECVNAAVGAADGEADFFFQERSSQDHFAGIPCSSSLSLDFMKQVPDLATSRVPVLSLDSFLATRQVGRVDLLKADTESTEPDVLRGAQGVIARDRPDIVCEVLPGHGTGRLIADLLSGHGYRYYHLTREGPLERAEIVGDARCLNHLFSTRRVDDILADGQRTPSGEPGERPWHTEA